MKRFVGFMLACLMAMGLLGCGAGQAEASLPRILIGSDTYPPYIYMDNNGGITGLDVEIARKAFRRMGYEADFTTIDWLIPDMSGVEVARQVRRIVGEDTPSIRQRILPGSGCWWWRTTN